jgi:hypothetical protein
LEVFTYKVSLELCKEYDIGSIVHPVRLNGLLFHTVAVIECLRSMVSESIWIDS